MAKTIDGRELASTFLDQAEAAEDIKNIRRQIAELQDALAKAEQRLAQVTAERRRLLERV